MRDPSTRTRFWFGPLEYRVLSALDGRTTIPAIAASLGCASHAEHRQIHQLVAAFGRAGLLESRGGAAERLAARQATQAAERKRWGQLRAIRIERTGGAMDAIAEAATSSCDDCRLHCCSFMVHVTEAELAPLAEAGARLGMPPDEVFHPVMPPGAVGAACLGRRLDGTCVMLDGEGRCRIHAAVGLERKPLPCQLYPAIPVLTPDGPRVGLRVGCTSPGTTREAGPVAEMRRFVRTATDTRSGIAVRVAPDTVLVEGEREVPWASYAAWDAEALRAAETAPDAHAALGTAIALARARFGLVEAEGGDGRALALAASLAELLGDHGWTEEARALSDLAEGEPGAPWCPARPIAAALRALEPLRAPTVLAGLGVLRLVVETIARHPAAAADPVTVSARVFRRFEVENVRDALLGAQVQTLEAWATLEV